LLPVFGNEIFAYIAIFLVSLLCSYGFSIALVPRLKKFGFVGKDMHKAHNPEVAEMGGISIVVGLSAGILLAIMLSTFNGLEFNIVFVLAGLLTIQILAFIGILDDLLDVPQWAKAFIPLLSAVPLIAVTAAGSTTMLIPFIGTVDFGILYMLLLLPVGVAVASNLTNMLAGFNGIEAGMGAVLFACMCVIAWAHGSPEMLVLFVPMLGALLGFLPKNWCPASVFPGDVGTLTIGAVLATGVIIGDLESAGAMIMALYVLDFLIKLPNKFPKTFVGLKYGKVVAPTGRPRGLVDVVLKLAGGLEEYRLVLVMMGLQLLVGIGVILIFVRV
jgi:UDP-N-acetylglucosamine--dolichyl-phosphate N-acetylglucosaminephosphotransferase